MYVHFSNAERGNTRWSTGWNLLHKCTEKPLVSLIFGGHFRTTVLTAHRSATDMPIFKYFDQIPPFSSEVQIVPLPKVSLEELQNGSGKERQLLFQACQEWGFFSLDLQGSTKGDELLQNAEQMFDLTKETFDLDQSVLDSYAYKPPTNLTG